MGGMVNMFEFYVWAPIELTHQTNIFDIHVWRKSAVIYVTWKSWCLLLFLYIVDKRAILRAVYPRRETQG